jgi:hypothetical protein
MRVGMGAIKLVVNLYFKLVNSTLQDYSGCLLLKGDDSDAEYAEVQTVRRSRQYCLIISINLSK